MEKREKGSPKWQKVSPHEMPVSEFTGPNLIEGKEYEFRVAAVNAAGPGQFSNASDKLKAPPPPCKMNHVTNIFCFLSMYDLHLLFPSNFTAIEIILEQYLISLINNL